MRQKRRANSYDCSIYKPVHWSSVQEWVNLPYFELSSGARSELGSKEEGFERFPGTCALQIGMKGELQAQDCIPPQAARLKHQKIQMQRAS
ncbi:hypothetical protein NEUTE1DRAFT_101779 [Neurospora tetrasperma FGSC 2508]|uniref:Uncharacterized protein n=3 Tax=Neurospora TaxID=5140 RepID=A0AAJ0I628_9PEZI|nr:uncharacterized protein NEUTE1DRAFT_101779 [Neurospora tetrasperma FGSC 2508]EGO56500.1 hypothetical protein NEUTE1DRAFT_101779 [Neurospora tetrasperma FGSC 2508]KAK3490803.1 hypothetical protein B0T23DRAFT_405597 [Neurospora hispaniola]